MSKLNDCREILAEDLLERHGLDTSIGSIGAWITVDGVDVWVQATLESHIEEEDCFHDDTPINNTAKPGIHINADGQIEFDL